jgi:lipopolysaccharide transport system permease protein
MRAPVAKLTLIPTPIIQCFQSCEHRRMSATTRVPNGTTAPQTTANTRSGEVEFYQPPREPLVTIEARKSWDRLNPAHLWAYRELVYFLALRDVKIRYKQTALGIVWVVLQPVLSTLVFTIILGKLAGLPSDNLPYFLFAYTGLVLWSFFSGSILATSNSLVANAHIITKVYFPRFIIPISSIVGRVVDLGIGLVILVGLIIYFQVDLTPRLLLLPALIALLALLALGFGMWISAVNVKYRDVSLAVPVLTQLWMFMSPVVYPTSMVPPNWRLVYSLNPLVGIIDAFRALLLGRRLDGVALGISAFITVVVLIYGAYAFRNRERGFADIV